ncbi:MAG TPA: exo-alpha-sialidase [Lentisphaeria bacterium]|nr:MAG: hypothetical protein A2X48_21150 [Lentisphaerae bacterium GWF2_49_21]HBC88651.1 exo-alpha-sialidase [Lentisphaeria bacterium]
MKTEASGISKTPLFEARTNGYHVYRIPGILAAGDNVVLATAEARRGKGGDYDNNDVFMRRSEDNGLSWGDPVCIVANETYGPGPVSNFVMISDRENKSVLALFCHDYNRVFSIRSTDGGKSFSKPVEITSVLESYRKLYPWTVIATGPSHGIQLRNGRYVVPLWMSDGSGTEMGKGNRGHRPSSVGVIYSDDHGKTWKCGDIVANTEPGMINPNETTVVELSDGRVLFNIRSECHENRRLVSISPDGDCSWSKPVFDDDLLEPICMGCLVKVPCSGSKSAILFSNPRNLERNISNWGTTARCDRKNLTLHLSYDDCKTWPVKKLLEDGPSGYSDLTVTSDGTIMCLYECGTVTGMYDDKYLMLARFRMEFLTTNHTKDTK